MEQKAKQPKYYQINAERLIERMHELGKIGLNEQGGIDRQLGSDADCQARAWLKNCWEKEAGLTVKLDAIANMWGTTADNSSELKPIILGSHHDSVPNGGKFDGAMGVLIATEIMQTVLENGIKLRHPLGIVSFTGEEPNSFSVSTLGSKVLCGRLKRKDLLKLHDQNNGEPLKAAISRLGGDIEQADSARLNNNSMAAFIECHIEQGRRLYDKQETAASVSCITGIYREIITIDGEANHAGTTQLKYRRDAANAAAEVCLAVENIMKANGHDEISATIGRIEVSPGSMSIIPGQAVLTLDLRTAEPVLRKQALEDFSQAVQEIAGHRRVKITREINLDQSEMKMDDAVIDSLNQAIVNTGQSKREFVSMAGHDAANMARLTRAGMLFVQSINGYSHCPQEMTSDADVVRAAQILLDALLILDGRLD